MRLGTASALDAPTSTTATTTFREFVLAFMTDASALPAQPTTNQSPVSLSPAAKIKKSSVAPEENNEGSAWEKLKKVPFAYAFVRLLIVLTVAAATYIILLHVVQPQLLAVLRKARIKEVDEKGVEAVVVDIVRERTIVSAAISFLNAFVIILAIIMGLSIMGVHSTALITAAGVGSLVIGLAAQSILVDVISGLLLLAEDQFNIGDTVILYDDSFRDGVQGNILTLGVRTTALRQFDGSISYLPNGKITLVTNLSKTSQRAMINVSISSMGDTDVEVVVSAFNDMCNFLIQDPNVRENFVSPPQVLGVTDMELGQFTLGIVGMVKAGTQWGTERYMRYAALRVLEALRVNGNVEAQHQTKTSTSPRASNENKQRQRATNNSP